MASHRYFKTDNLFTIPLKTSEPTHKQRKLHTGQENSESATIDVSKFGLYDFSFSRFYKCFLYVALYVIKCNECF